MSLDTRLNLVEQQGLTDEGRNVASKMTELQMLRQIAYVQRPDGLGQTPFELVPDADGGLKVERQYPAQLSGWQNYMLFGQGHTEYGRPDRVGVAVESLGVPTDI